MLEEKTYKGYKELKEAMQWKGNSTQITKGQLEELEKVCKYTKDGRSYRIIKVNTKSMEDMLLERELITPVNKDYDRYLLIELLLLLKDFADKEGGEAPYYTTRMKLMEDLNMINKNYRKCYDKQEALSTILNIEEDTIKDFYNSSSNMMEKDIERVLKILNNLNDSKLFFISIVQRGIWKDEGNKVVYYNLNDEQLRDYERCVIEALKELKLESVQSVFLHHQLDKLYTVIDYKMNELYEDYISSYRAYKFIFTYESIDYVLKNRHKNRRTLKRQVNEGIINSIMELALDRHNKEMIKAYEEDSKGWGQRNRTDNIRIKENYVKDTNKLNNNLISTKSKNIVDKVNTQHNVFLKNK